MRTSLFLVALFGIAMSMDLSDKGTVWEGMPDYPLASMGYTLTNASDSGNCKVEICNGGKSEANYYATYEDGPRILICICQDPSMNVTGMAFRQGQVPLAVRSSVATITAGSQGMGGGAWTIFNDIAYFGDFVPNVFIHESAHALDFAQGDMYGGMGLSDSDAWHKAIDASSCCPDPYAKSDEAEDWAQNTVARYWAKSLNKPFNAPKTSCMTPQLQYAFAALPERNTFNSKKTFFISNLQGKVLATKNAATADNSPLVVASNTSANNQRWKIMPTAYDYYIACEQNSYRCVDNQRNTDDGVGATVGYRTAFISMQHKFVQLGDGEFKIINRISGLALSSGCPHRKAHDAVYVEDDGSDCQKWKITATDNSQASSYKCPNSIGSTLSSHGSTNTITVSGRYMTSPDCKLRLVPQADGNLVLYNKNGGVKWSSDTYGNADNEEDNTLIMQNDGNLVFYNVKAEPIWNTATNGQGKGPYTLSVSNAAKVTIKDSTGAQIWSN